ncbi:tetratricopeptide repeat protein [cf. Phormidesmis sp. LEGE 11477]|uniref:tetratricopeptide repeat protein n=1 Tax=cf. Phormidesmis sp. LEGE 11477 TaxID=1828680 RepID=UPI0018811CDF|nr:tetratricopeptide repeat protein [cf. Phormidesmis sp. LEGE 11477]MBE9060727.1 tetratricopeptide repeat protein [cf. Phormidesmis sp. LEGE 11477]
MEASNSLPALLPNLLVWIAVVLGIAGFAVFSMVSAYRRPIDQVPFPNSVVETSSIPLSTAAQTLYIAAVGTYRAGDYRGAIEQFTELLNQEPNCAEAFHNLGLAYANVGDNNKAVRSLLKAGDAYDQQGTKEGLEQIKQTLEKLKSS